MLPLPTYHTNRTQTYLLDNSWQGHDLSQEKQHTNTRIMFHNVNGLSLKGTHGFDMFVNEQSAHQVDIQAFSEHCLDTSKIQIIHEANTILRKNFIGQSTLHLSSSQETSLHQYKPGGTGILALGTVSSRLEPKGRGSDPMGRWCYFHLRRKNSPPVTIISAYQVCPRPTNHIGNTAFHQQQRALHLAGRPTIHPRQAFISDLADFVAKLLHHKHEVILGGDFNEALSDKNSGILQLAMRHNLIDPFQMLFPHQTEFGTHSQGHRRIDIVLVTHGLIASIQSIGYSPFQFANNSDHRAMILDFNTAKMFGEPYDTLAFTSERRLKSNDKRAVQKFVTTFYSELVNRNAFRYQQEIDNDTTDPSTVETLDRIIGISGDIAEQKCQRRRPDFYSNTIVQQRLKVSILRGHLNSLKMNRDRTLSLQNRMARLGVDFSLPPTIHLSQQALKNARDELNASRTKSFELRQTELEDKIKAASLKGERHRRKALRAIHTVETGRKTHKILKAMKRNSDTVQLDRIEIPASWPPAHEPVTSLEHLEDPKQCTEWRLVTQPDEIEFYLMMRNRLHFGQAEGTPFTQDPLQTDIDWAASTVTATHILSGEYSKDLPNPTCKLLIESCRAQTTLDDIPAELNMLEFKSKIKTWRESTTTSPSGRHLGRYKSLFATGEPTPAISNTETNTLQTQQETIASCILSVINYCIRHKHVLARWKTIVNVMIFKEPSNYKIHRLRVIHIYEADFNLLLAVKWRKTLQRADAQGTINPGQYGGRPGCEAQALTLLEELKYDLSYLTRRTMVNFDNDATSCYDRIIVPLASLINRKYGIHQQVVAVHALTLQKAQFRLKTATGVSQLQYTHCREFPIHGTGQGSGNSPCIWLFISSTLFDIHYAHSKGITFVSPDGGSEVRMSMVGFVDDSTGSCNDFRPNTQSPLTEILKMMEHDAQLWNNLLFSSGGKLELPKCSFHVLHFEFRPNGKPVPSIEKFENQIHIIDSENNATIPITSKRAFETHKTLGHYKSPSTSLRHTIKTVQQTANRIALLIAMSPITRQGALVAYQTVYLPTIKYTLPQSFYPHKLLEQTQAQSHAKIFSKCGYNRHTSQALLFAPLRVAGAGFVPWYALQGEGQIRHLIKHWRTDTIVSKTLRLTLQWAQWQSGHDKSILEDTTAALPHLESRWLTSARQFLSTIQASVILDNSYVANKERRDDIFIMTHASQTGLFTTKDLVILNYCRLYVHITTLSELFDADGKHILPHLWHCQREPWFNTSTYVTLQQRPTEYHIRTVWQRYCRQWTKSDGSISEQIKFGRWTTPGHQLRRYRQTYATRLDTRIIYHWKESCYWKFTLTATPNTFQAHEPTNWLPVAPYSPVTADEIDNSRIRVLHRPDYYTPLIGSRVQPPSLSFESYTSSLPAWEKHLLLGAQLYFQPYEIQHLLNTNTTLSGLYLVSDGSQKGKEMTYGWVFGTATGLILAEHSGPGHGQPSSHRAEAWGMLSGLLFVHHLRKYTTHPHHPSNSPHPITCFSDNSGLIHRIKQRHTYEIPYPNATLATDWDLVEQIWAVARSTPNLKITFEWVKGHQDETDDDDLSIEAQYNIKADALAGNHRCTPTDHKYPEWLLPSERCRLVIQGIPCHGYYTQTIQEAYTLPKYFTYIQSRYNWSNEIRNMIDWDALHQATSTSALSTVQLLKLVYHKMPTRAERAKSHRSQSPQCPHCEERETFLHLLQCSNPSSQTFRDDVLESLDDYFTTTNTSQQFRQLFLCSIQMCYNPNLSVATPLLDKYPCLNDQKQIGWTRILQGFLSQSWRTVYKDSSPSSPTRSSVNFIAGIIHTMWYAQLRFWKTYLATQHVNDPTTPNLFQDRSQAYKSRIRFLHTQKSQCLHAHRDQYFYANVEEFLQTATVPQMRQYLHHYEPVIRKSLKEAQCSKQRPIFRFLGFTYQPAHRTTPRLLPTSRNLNSSHASTTQPRKKEGLAISRKHTRWKTMTSSMKKIHQFFNPSPT